MKRRGLGILSLAYFIVGMFFLLSGFQITGFAISESIGISRGFSFYFGILFLTISFLIFTNSRKYLPESVLEAIARGVPENDALRIHDECNAKVGSGEWVDLMEVNVRDAHNVYAPQATSIVRYWGPKELKGASRTQLLKLYDGGKIGKTHEILRGAATYKQEGRLSEGTMSMPPHGSRVFHRHWEIAEMYKYRQKEKS
ncbi:hypothetical protein J4217_02540 [Candidatus Pacearchaeota archaeon]|nr:hypothetical protein [Candidatus Pacearchaeota archaeon]